MGQLARQSIALVEEGTISVWEKKFYECVMPEISKEKFERTSREKESIEIDWKQETGRTDVRHLREIVNNDTSIENLQMLTKQRFTISPEDVTIINSTGHKYREKMAEKGKQINANYDYSIESRVFLSFVLHKMRELNISEGSLSVFQNFIDTREREYIMDPNSGKAVDDVTGKTFELLEEEQLRAWKETADQQKETDKIIKIIDWASDYFRLMDRLCYADKNSKLREERDSTLGIVPVYEGRISRGEYSHDFHAYISARLFLKISMKRLGGFMFD